MQRDLLVRFFEEQIPYNRVLGIRVEHLEPGRCRLRVPFRDELVGDPFRPALHGGVISALADAAGGLATFSSVEWPSRVSTIDIRVDYLRPGLLDALICDAEVVRTGNRVAVTSMRIWQRDEAYITAEGRAVYNVVRPEPTEPADRSG